jgi:hypothetical protein
MVGYLKRKDIIINYDTRDDFYVRTYVKSDPVLIITIYVYKKELFDSERVARIDIIFPKILGNEVLSEELKREVYERVH